MSLNRFAPRRDANEPAIRKRFDNHGWHTDQLSGSGMVDLLVFLPERMAASRPAFLVDVKMPAGKVTKAQEKKWAELNAKGIPVYVVRTVEDVDALVRGELAAWEPRAAERDAGIAVDATVRRGRAPRIAYAKTTGPVYAPPRSKPVNAAKEAEETFAPCPYPACSGDCEHTRP